ncbi:L-seryl-tRNA(Sec) selenium transferase [Hydrogenophaga crassostreae]|uniref:L-seryl-tRNA(Sec) selenium transferase n=1 Tax=Hydrogenophaga crassostreae TaxID=1763535 RepID=A0A167IPT5_9BURK|nr:L-seryl-tRNA(Sec) selenium transferase [Hydrogenophaga crassostreae]AOW14591.1 L-seryl-tRNA(Sec) selenium transferase [Hydrogenophaga crassostreae]OAD43311.1 L-seryl-tRNA(Sec) selenium transferase [Hydrogenophaga crassostreae]
MTALDRGVHLRLPAVDRVLGWPAISALIESHGRSLVLQAARDELAFLRERAEGGTDEGIAHGIHERVDALVVPTLRKVFNLTGTVLHTNLGRAPLPPEAIEAMVQVASGASNLEYDLGTGKRGDRDDHVEALLCRLTGAEAATVVNNNAAAVLLTLNSLALRREVIVSRGELIEIGGAFRLPDIMARAGCKLHEVGTTNRTHLRDFEKAMGTKTALVLKAHASNYSIQGFTAEADERKLGALCKERGLPFVVDLGSGTLVDLARFGLPHEPTPAQTVTAGADLVTFSGDKLLGGPQAGIIVGRASLVAAIKKNPMKRAMRCDKLTIAALGAVLRLYENPERLIQRVPVLRLLARPPTEIAALAHRVLPLLSQHLGTRGQVDVVPVMSQIGSGSLPVDLLPSFALRIKPVGSKKGSGRWLDQLAGEFRKLPIPVIGRIADGAFLLDLRCLEDEAGFLAMLTPSPE